MRRGLMGWDEAELPRSVLTARLERLQAAMARQGLEADDFAGVEANNRLIMRNDAPLIQCSLDLANPLHASRHGHSKALIELDEPAAAAFL